MLIDPIEAVRAAIASVGVSQNEAARLANMTSQALSTKMVNKTFRAKDWLHLMDSIGVDVVLINRSTGDKIRPILNLKGCGQRAKGTSEGVKYDTEYSDCLASSFYADGINEFTDGIAEELYIDGNSRYFMAVYKENEKPKIRAVSGNVAKAFIEKYGPLEK